jgi:hypothetical protein
MEAKNFLIKTSNGKNTSLDKAYHKHINYVLENLDEENEYRWEIYNLIIIQLVKQGKNEYFKEIKYRLTDGEDPNYVILEIIERESENIDSMVWFLKRKIEEYIEEDYFIRFLQ